MKVVQKNENSGNIISSNVTIKESLLNRGTSEFRGAVVFKNDVTFKGGISGLTTENKETTKIIYCNNCPTSKFPPPLASTFGPSFIAADDGIYKFHVEISFMQNPNSEATAFLTADFYVNGSAIHEKTPESYEKFILTRTFALKKDDKVELRLCEDFFSGTTYVLDPSASYYEITRMV